jgi:uncharacterized protein (TIGR00251 family)
MKFSVRVTPGAAKARVGGAWTGPDGAPRLVIRVAAPPDKGRANRAVIEALAEALGVPKSALSIAAGEKDRQKTISIEGDESAITARLQSLLKGQSA